jgi:endonuclease III
MNSHDFVRQLLAEHGQTYAAEAGIRLNDKPKPLFQLLVLCTLLAKPIGSDLAVAAARELFLSGYRTPRAMLDASWQDRVDAFTRAHYRRFDESSATRMEQLSRWLCDKFDGDLRALVVEHAGEMAKRLTAAPGIGPAGADIFLRESQHVWQWLRPYADRRVLDLARKQGLPHTARGLADAAGTDDLSAVGAALIRSAT